jgi:hypothetical protein
MAEHSGSAEDENPHVRHTNNTNRVIDSQDTMSNDAWFAVAAGAVLVFAAALRFHGLDVSLFEDEVWVAELVRRGGWHAHSYLTPPLFYAVERCWAAIAGTSPRALRTMPAFLGVVTAAVPLFATTERRMTRLIWSALLAGSSPLVFYATRIKQYPLEAAVAAALIVLFLRARERDTGTAWLAFFAAAVLGVTTLYEPIFLLAACGAVCIRRPRLVLAFAGVAAVFALAYRGWLSAGPESTLLHGDMTAYFSANGRWITSPRLLLSGTTHWTGQAMNLVRGWWVAAGLLVIVWMATSRKWTLVALAALPPLLIAAASALHVYPYGEVRLMIVSFPAVYLILADSLARVTQRVPFALLLLVPFALSTSRYNDTYMHLCDLRPLFDFVAANHGTELVYATPSLAAPLRFHHPESVRYVVEWRDGNMTRPGWYVGPSTMVRGSSRIVIGDEAAAHIP